MRSACARPSRFGWIVAAMCAVPFTSSGTFGAGIRLSLEPAVISAAPGAAIEVQLWARGDSAQSFDGAEVELRWDAAALTLTGASNESASFAWSTSDLPASSPLNTSLTDGDALFQCLAPLGGAPPATDLLLTRLQFVASAAQGQTAISISRGNTFVPSSGIDILTETSGSSVTVGTAGGGSGSSGGSSGGTGGAPDEPATDDDEPGAGSSDPGPGGPGTPVDSNQNGDTSDVTNTGGGASPDGAEPASGETQDDATPVTVATPFCGAGVAQAAILCMLAMALHVARRQRSC